MRLWALIVMLFAAPALAQDRRAGDFDYYVLALSWSPNWCATTGDARGSDQCNARHDHGWILHGLWPQYHRGWPQFCQSGKQPPSRSQTRAMTDIMGSPGLAWHQWKKHGTCSGLDASGYFALSRAAYARITRPAAFRKLNETVRLPARVVEAAFLKANKGLEPDGITITCKQGHIAEARICLSRDLQFVPCGADVVRDCLDERALFTPVR